MRFAANLSFLFADAPFEARFGRAARAGFRAVEFLFPYGHDLSRLKTLVVANDLRLALFNLPPGDWDKGERGLACLPGRGAEFREGVAQALEYAQKLGNRLVHCMAGIMPKGAELVQLEEIYLSNLSFACAEAAKAGLTVTIEPINPVDMPGYFLTSMEQAERMRARVGAANLKLQFDAYHCAMSGRDPVAEWRLHRAQIAHVQVAGCPGRHEPDTPQMTAFLEALKADNYSGFIGCEYHPRGMTEAGLGWIKPRADRGDSPVR